MEQNSAEWIAARLGKFGASAISRLMPTKGEGKDRASYLAQVIGERLSGKPQGWEGDDSTDSGHEQEPLARRAYEELTGSFVLPGGRFPHPAIPTLGASPDGLVDDDGGLEIKSHVRFVTHLKAIESKPSRAHTLQCQTGMACTGRAWWDYGHYCAEAPEHMRLFMFPRIYRDDVVIAQIEAAVRKAEIEVQQRVNAWQTYMALQAQFKSTMKEAA